MTFPAFFDQVETITVRDPLAEFLGAAEGGVIEYRYADAVRLAGHSCPTVAGAWLMCARALERLWPEGRPERGGVAVSFRDSQGEGVTGVIAAVVGLVTGAAGEGGFKGIAGRFARHHLLAFARPVEGEAAFERLDTGVRVVAAFDTAAVPFEPRQRELIQRILGGLASADEEREFRHLWQDRVRRLLLDHARDPAVVRLG